MGVDGERQRVIDWMLLFAPARARALRRLRRVQGVRVDLAEREAAR